jgi:hypothetical protein
MSSTLPLQGTVGFAGVVLGGLHYIDGKLLYPVGATMVVRTVANQEQVRPLFTPPLRHCTTHHHTVAASTDRPTMICNIHAKRNLQHEYITPKIERNVQRVTRNAQRATRNTQHATRNTQHATRNMHATCMQHGTQHSMQDKAMQCIQCNSMH